MLNEGMKSSSEDKISKSEIPGNNTGIKKSASHTHPYYKHITV